MCSRKYKLSFYYSRTERERDRELGPEVKKYEGTLYYNMTKYLQSRRSEEDVRGLSDVSSVEMGVVRNILIMELGGSDGCQMVVTRLSDGYQMFVI